MRILVTGSSGFIGSHLLRKLQNDGFRALGVSRRAPHSLTEFEAASEVKCNLTSPTKVEYLMRAFKPNVIFHLSGNPLVRDWGVAASESNFITTHNLLEHAPEGARFVFASSAEVYGRSINYAMEITPLRPKSAYGAAKAGAEHLVRAYTTSQKVDGISLRLVATVGAGATHGLLPDLVRKLKGEAECLELLGAEPGSIKPFIHVSDVVKAFLHFGLRTNLDYHAVNIAPDDEISVQDAAQLAMEVTGISKPIRWLGEASTWQGDSPKVCVWNNVARNFGWEPVYPKSADAVRRALEEMK